MNQNGKMSTGFILVVIGLVIFTMFATREKTPKSAPPVAVESINVGVTSQIVKQVDGKYRYFFDIRNNDTKPFTGDVNIELFNTKGENIYGDTFTTKAPMAPSIGTSEYIEAYTGPVSVHYENGIYTFKYTVKAGGNIVKTGSGAISSKLE